MRGRRMSAARSSAASSDFGWWRKTMSRIGKKPVPLPKGVTAKVEGGNVAVKGPKGELKLRIVPELEASVGETGVAVKPRTDTDRARAMWGMQRTLINNLVVGVTQGFQE